MSDALQLRLGLESQVLNRFDTAWQSWSATGGSGEPPNLAAFLPSGPPPRAFVIELVKVDLDFRWRYSKKLAGVNKFTETAELSRDSSDRQPPATPGAAVRLPPCPKLEDYVANFPALGPLDSQPIELIALEFAKRHAYGDQPSITEFIARFPLHGEPLRAALHQLANRQPTEKAAATPSNEAMPGLVSLAATGSANLPADRTVNGVLFTYSPSDPWAISPFLIFSPKNGGNAPEMSWLSHWPLEDRNAKASRGPSWCFFHRVWKKGWLSSL